MESRSHPRVRKIALDWLLETAKRPSTREECVIRNGAGLYRRFRFSDYPDDDLYAIKRPEKGPAELVLFNLEQYGTGLEEITRRHSAIKETIEESGVEWYSLPLGVALRARLDLKSLGVIDSVPYENCVHTSALLLAQGRRRVLLEVDPSSKERWYAAEAGRSKTVEEARSRLVPPAAREADAYWRQGGWFFLPAPEMEEALEGGWVKNNQEGFPGFLLQDRAAQGCSHIATWGALYRQDTYVKGTVRHWRLDGENSWSTERHPMLRLEGVCRAIPTDVRLYW